MRYLFYLALSVTLAYSTTLDEISKYALKHSPLIKEAEAQSRLIELNHKQSRSDQYGELNLIGDYNHYNIERTLAPLTPSSISSGTPITTSEDILSVGLSYSVALFTGFAQTKTVEIEGISKEMADIKVDLTKEQLIFNIRSLYLAVLSQQEVLKAQNSYIETLESLTNQIEKELQLGKKAKIDLLKAKVELKNAQTKRETLSSNIEITLASLSAMVGKNVDTNLTPIDVAVEELNYSKETLFKESLSLSRVKIDNLNVKKADRFIAKSSSSKFPTISLNSYYGKNYGKDIQSGDIDNETLWQIGLKAQYNLIDFNKRDISTQKAKVAKLQAILKKERNELELKKLLSIAILNINRSKAEHEGNQAELELSKKTEMIELKRYESGVSTLNDLLLAKNRTQFAKSKLIQSRYEYQKNRYYLEYLQERGVNGES